MHVPVAWSASWTTRSVTLNRVLRGPTADLVSLLSHSSQFSFSESWSVIWCNRQWLMYAVGFWRLLDS